MREKCVSFSLSLKSNPSFFQTAKTHCKCRVGNQVDGDLRDLEVVAVLWEKGKEKSERKRETSEQSFF